MPSSPPAAVFVDGHVHLHGCFDPPAFLSAAHRNFEAQAKRSGVESWSGALLFTESESVDWFQRLAANDPAVCDSGWRIRPLSEPCSLTLAGPRGESLTIIAGCQIVTAERLELLAIGTTDRIPDGTPMGEALSRSGQSGAIRVLPWGNGKWVGPRGHVVRSLIEAAQRGDFFLGDNSGRWRWAPAPREFALGRQRGLFVLPGSDPLPFAGETDKVASYGFRVPGPADAERPFAWLRAKLAAEPEHIEPYGEGERLVRFVKNQVAMQLRKRLG